MNIGVPQSGRSSRKMNAKTVVSVRSCTRDGLRRQDTAGLLSRRNEEVSNFSIIKREVRGQESERTEVRGKKW